MASNAATAQIRGIVVSHTHWDREWYLSFQRFRMLLVDTVDALLDILDNDRDLHYFTLDGQTVVLEDYLEIRPENEERLARHIRDGRLLIGPWYILPDEFLVSAESLVRNLLIGRQVARRFGEPMPVGYLPDTFGHPAQMPQILRRWGFDSAVLFRGVIPPASEFIWRAPDGSEVLTVFMPGGYCNAAGLAAGPDRFLEQQLGNLVEKLRATATTPNILVMGGCDHFPARPALEGYLARGNALLEDVTLEQGTLPQFISRVKAERPKLAVLEGEFRQPRPGRVTPGVLSARMYLKQENHKSTNLLERYAEPLTALCWLIGKAHPDAYLSFTWKQLLQNHPHDSICGVSIDAVHRDMLTRFHYAQDVAGELIRRALADLAGSVDAARADPGFLIFNPACRERKEVASQVLHFLERDRPFRLVDSRGQTVPHQIVARRDVVLQYRNYARSVELDGRAVSPAPMLTREEMTQLVGEGRWQRWEGEEIEILFPAHLPALGYATYGVLWEDVAPVPLTDLRAGESWLENEHLQVEVDPHGQVTVLEKRAGRIYGPLNVFEDGGDRGDEYTYCPPERDAMVSSSLTPATVRLIETGPLRATLQISTLLRVPRRLTPDRQARDDRSAELLIVSRVSLTAGGRRVEVTTEVENHAEDHRLRVVFNAPLVTDWSHAHGQFEVTQRKIDLDPAEIGREPDCDEEVAVTTFPHATFVDVNDGAHGLAVLNQGLPEYEALRTDTGTQVALTLLRSVGWLSRPDLSTRAGNAGPMLATPEAQCVGKHIFHYAVVPHEGDWDMAAIPDEAACYVAPPIGTSLFGQGLPGAGSNGGVPRPPLPGSRGFVSVSPSQVTMSAVKKATDEDAIVVRVYNTTSRPIATRLAFGWPVIEVTNVSLAEEDLGQPAMEIEEGGVITFHLTPHEIRTLRVR